MNIKDEEFIDVFIGYYSFENYIFSVPIQITSSSGDIALLEIVVPVSSLFQPTFRSDETLQSYTRIDWSKVYLSIICKGSFEVKFLFSDFSSTIREEIIGLVIEDFGKENWENLYLDISENSVAIDDLREALQFQADLITERYGTCEIKKYMDDIIKSILLG